MPITLPPSDDRPAFPPPFMHHLPVGYPSSTQLRGLLRRRSAFVVGVRQPVMTGAHGTAYPQVDTPAARAIRATPQWEADQLQLATEAAYAAALEADPGTYTVRSFDNLLCWHDGKRWYMTAHRIGRTGSAHRRAVQGALSETGYHTLRFRGLDTHES